MISSPISLAKQEILHAQTLLAPHQKQEALRLLAIHNDNVPIVHQLTGIPRSTLYYWREQESSNKIVSIGQKNIPSPIGDFQHAQPPPADHPNAELIQDGDFQYWRLPDGRVFANLSATKNAKASLISGCPKNSNRHHH